MKARVLIFGVIALLCSNAGKTISPQFFKIKNNSQAIIHDIETGPKGFTWLATSQGLARYDGYEYLFIDQHTASSAKNFVDIRINKDEIWLLSKQNQIYKYEEGRLFEFNLDLTLNQVNDFASYKEGLLIAQNQNVTLISKDKKLSKHSSELISDLTPISSVSLSNSSHLYLSAGKNIFSFDLDTKRFSLIFSGNDLLDSNIRKIKLSPTDELWIATSQKLFHLKLNSVDSIEEILGLPQSPVIDIEFINDEIWLSIFNYGLIKLQKHSKVSNFKHNRANSKSISENTITSLHSDNTNLMLGTFSQGLNTLNIGSLNFNKIDNFSEGFKCFSSNYISTIYEVDSSRLLVGTDNGLYLTNSDTSSCNKIYYSDDDTATVKNVTPKSKNEYWIGTTKGLRVFNITSGEYASIKNANLDYVSNVIKLTNKVFILTKNSIYEYDHVNKNFEQRLFLADNTLSSATAFNKSILLGTHKGLLIFHEDNSISSFDDHSNLALRSRINAISLDINNNILIAGRASTIYIFNIEGNLIKRIDLDINLPRAIVFDTLIDKHQNIWASTNDGLFRVSKDASHIKKYHFSDGLQGNSFINGSSFQTPDGKLYFGGRNGFNAFYPEDIKDNLVTPKVALTKLTRFNEEVIPGEDYEGFSIEKQIEYLDKLEIGHRDYVIGFEFAGLHFADPMRNQYQYKLEGFHDDWVSTDAKNRTATFTNLSPGDYVFRVKAANKDGIWSLEEDNVALKISVHPAPWLSWWAFTIYGLVIIGSILWFIRYRTQSAITRATELEQEVSLRTKEIETQKNVIESLLERKNELFANISHEFRTPLTLILGPLEKELKALDSPKNLKHLQMIQRNATRLLGMVEQILKLTELKKEDTVNKVPHAVNPALEAIVDSFGSFAESKQIELSLNLNKDANVMAANDALEVMVGNLVSNAIKYTPEGGQVSLMSNLSGGNIQISVTDTGVGMTPEQQKDVFERFVRLDKTSDIAGTGIGLSIVKELVRAHDGQVQVDSIEGQGSTFTISLPITKQAALSETHSIKSIEHLTQGETKTSETTQAAEASLSDNQQELVLIIDDNPDMRDYIQEVLAPNYHCITADRGEAGIELAKTQVPDLIICDIMMPGINGYEVAKRLRGDIITSHIPLVLLTAKGDKESRIQGWNENIDDYMTKPFDVQELKARVSNIISVRNLIRSKAKTSDKSSESNSREKNISKSYTKVDQKWLNKLSSVLENNYSSHEFGRVELARLMALSERQFQRKLKALINKTPTEFIKEFRIEKSAKFILEGHPVNLAADRAGFLNLSHFSQCFKAYFGTTPSKYNQL